MAVRSQFSEHRQGTASAKHAIATLQPAVVARSRIYRAVRAHIGLSGMLIPVKSRRATEERRSR